MAPATGPSDGRAAEAWAPATVSVDPRSGVISIRLRHVAQELPDLALAQLICTAAEAQRTTDTGTGVDTDANANAATVTVKVTDARGRSAEGSDERCPDG